MVCMAAVAGMLLGLPVAVVGSVSTESAPAGVRCEQGTGDCGELELQEPAPQATGLESHHPCDWVETCQLPCGREGGQCCHAEWNCPPDAKLPRC